MERTQAIDRLIAALTPAVSAEVERTLEEAQKKLEDDFKIRLQAAALEAETAARQSLQGEITRAAQEAGDAARRELMKALEPQIRQQIEDARRDARQRLKADLEATKQPAEKAGSGEAAAVAAERDRLQTQLAEWRVLAGAEIRLVEADSQMEMLARFMKLAAGFAESVAIYVLRPEGLTLWKSRGPRTFPATISSATAGADTYFRVVSARGKTVTAVAAAPSTRKDALDFLTGCLERSVKLLGLKLQNSSSTAPETPSASNEKIHAEARQTARTLVSEIASSREMEVINGRVNSDIYSRLQGAIETARRQYLEKVPCVIAASRDYFDEELVRELAENRPALMGAGYPGSRD